MLGGDFLSLSVFALAITVNPVPIIAVLALLATRHPRRNAAAFVATIFGIMMTLGLLNVLWLSAPDSSGRNQSTLPTAILQMVFGLIFLSAFVMQWRSKPDSSGAPQEPRWLKRMDAIGVGGSFVLGVALTNYALVSSGAIVIRKMDLAPIGRIGAMLYFSVIAALSIVAPLVWHIARRRRAETRLAELKEWLMLRSRTILMIVFGIMGCVFIAQGVLALL